MNKRLIPVVAQDVPDGAAPPAVAELNWVFAREGVDDLEEAAHAIVRALDTDIDLVRTHTLVLTRAQAWQLAGRRASPLLRGDELRRADVLLEAFARVATQIPTAKLVIAGDGPERGRLHALAAELGVTSAVEMLGHVSRDELQRRFSTAWVQAVPERLPSSSASSPSTGSPRS